MHTVVSADKLFTRLSKKLALSLLELTFRLKNELKTCTKYSQNLMTKSFFAAPRVLFARAKYVRSNLGYCGHNAGS